MSHIDFEEALNPEQRAAALAPDGPVLVIAAAGTGKTRTLTYRVAHLVERGVDPERILLLTFTNRAAQEMLARAAMLVGDRVGGIWGGTFHHLANRLLRRHAAAIGLPNDYTILDEDDAQSLIRECSHALGFKDKTFPKPEVLLSILGLAISRDTDPRALLTERLADTDLPIENILRVFETYTKRKREIRALDFDDLLVQARHLLRTVESIRASYQERFLHVLVDEYQDTNILQADLADLLAARHRNLLVVGDDFQSIYAWRGADYRYFLSFPQRYPDARIFKLETNYRSVPGILEVANVCIAGNPHQFQKTLRPVRVSDVRPRKIEVLDGRQQARWVIEEILRLQADGVALRDIAILYRAHFHALEMQLALEEAGIPYHLTSGVRFFEQAHIKDVCTLPRLAHKPSDWLAFSRLVCLFPGVGPRSAQRVWNKLGERFQPLASRDRDQLAALLPAAARERWVRISDELAAVESAPPALLASALIGAFCEGFYRAYAELTFEDAQRRMDDLEALREFTERYASLSDFLNEVALLTNADGMVSRGRHGEGENRVVLTTVHQAKGLEWRAVFILWLAEGLFPSGRAMADDPKAEEERRLFYVAVTRARDRLYLLSPRCRTLGKGDFKYYSPSRFLQEIPRPLLQVERVCLYR